MINAEEIGKIDGLGVIYRVGSAKFDEQLEALDGVGAIYKPLPSTDEVVEIRLQNISNISTRTNVACIALKNNPVILCKHSYLMNYYPGSDELMKAHAEQGFLQRPTEFYDLFKLLANLEEKQGIELEKRMTFAPPEKDTHLDDYLLTPKMDLTRFLFGKRAEAYFKVNNHTEINFHGLIEPTHHDCTNINYLNFGDVENYESEIDGWDMHLHEEESSLGIKREGHKR